MIRQAGKTGQGKTGQGKTGQGKTGQGSTSLGAGVVFAINRGSWRVRTGVTRAGDGIYATGGGDLALHPTTGRKTTTLVVKTSTNPTGIPVSTTTYSTDQTWAPLATMSVQELDMNLNPVTTLRDMRIVNTSVDTEQVNLLANPAVFTGSVDFPNTDIRFYKLQVRSVADPTVWEDFCQGAGVNGRAVFLGGVFDASGRFIADHPQYMSVACLDGTAAKCMRWGYRPWQSLSSSKLGSVSLEPLWRACTRAASADYCSNGHGYTEDGTRIDIWDRYGFIAKSPETFGWLDANGIPEAYSDESAFDEQGAVCLVRERLFTINATTAVCPMNTQFLSGNEACVDPLSGTWSACGPKGLVSTPTNVFDRRVMNCDRVASRPPLVYISSYDSGCNIHSPFETGRALGVDCNKLTTMVCTQARAACCAEDNDGHLLEGAWDATCVGIARQMVNGTWTPGFVY